MNKKYLTTSAPLTLNDYRKLTLNRVEQAETISKKLDILYDGALTLFRDSRKACLTDKKHEFMLGAIDFLIISHKYQNQINESIYFDTKLKVIGIKFNYAVEELIQSLKDK